MAKTPDLLSDRQWADQLRSPEPVETTHPLLKETWQAHLHTDDLRANSHPVVGRRQMDLEANFHREMVQ